MVSVTTKHYPVLLSELISIITPQHGGTFIDCTFGQGGYTKKILSYDHTQVIAIDRDEKSKIQADKLKEKYEGRFIFKNQRFSKLNNLKLKNKYIRGIIFDLGFSYTQIKDETKGLSFHSSGELNMRMGINDFSAKDVINKLDKKELEKIFKFFGEEKESKKISNIIVQKRRDHEIDNKSLLEIIKRVKRKNNSKIHNATKIFQALRIFVNKEISELIHGLIAASKVLKKDGALVVVTFNSIEDKIVKHFLRTLSEKKSISRYVPKLEQPESLFKLVKKKPIFPSSQELKENLPSRSAKLRYGFKKKNFYNFDTDIFEKFKYLLDVEKIGDKL